MGELVATEHFDFTPHLRGFDRVLAMAADCEGALYAAATQSDESLRFTRPRGGNSPKTHFDSPASYLLLRWDGEEMRSCELHAEQAVIHHIQPHPAGLLLANARCRWRPEGPDKNAFVVSWNGEVLDRFRLGDGISNLRVSPNGTIWAGYSDEGVYGNYGWHLPGVEPIGSRGLVAFGPSGDILRTYDPNTARTDWIDDVYAMNVAGDENVWLYFYSSFPIVNMRGDTYRVWNHGDRGSKTIVARDDRAMLTIWDGSTKQYLARIVQLQEDGSTKILAEESLADESGAEVADASFYGVGDRLYLFTGNRVLLVDDW